MLITTANLKKKINKKNIDMIPSISPPLVMEERWKSKVFLRGEEEKRGKNRGSVGGRGGEARKDKVRKGDKGMIKAEWMGRKEDKRRGEEIKRKKKRVEEGKRTERKERKELVDRKGRKKMKCKERIRLQKRIDEEKCKEKKDKERKS